MVVSDAFETLTQVLQCVESSDAEVKTVSVRGRTTAEKDEITADVTVATPVFGGAQLHEDVSVEAEEFDLTNQRAEFDLTVTVPVGIDVPNTPVPQGNTDDLASNLSQSESVPAYKDPEALAAAYEACDTFPEMTEALGAEVTSETVRRYMVEYDIHDPTETTPQAGGLSLSNVGAASENQDDAKGTDNSRESDTETDTDEPPEDPDGLGGRSVAELLADSDTQDSDDNLVADGLGVSRDLTVAELAHTVNQSTSLHEVTRDLEMSQNHARRLLSELDLLDLVTHRLAADQIRVSHAEIKRRITGNND